MRLPATARIHIYAPHNMLSCIYDLVISALTQSDHGQLLLYTFVSPYPETSFLFQQTPLLIFCQPTPTSELSLPLSIWDFCFNVLWNFNKTRVILLTDLILRSVDRRCKRNTKKLLEIHDTWLRLLHILLHILVAGLHEFAKYINKPMHYNQLQTQGKGLISNQAFCNDSEYTW